MAAKRFSFRIGHAFLFLVLCSARELSAQPTDISFYGIQTHFGQGRPDLDSLLNLVQAAGIGAIRDEVYWHEIETVKDSFVFKPEHDAYIKGALQRGVKPLIILDYGNSLYGGTPRDSVSRAAFARYCREVVGRYAPFGVKHFEIWNEPNICFPSFCPWPPAPNVSEYVALLKEAYTACKSVDSTVDVVGCSTSPAEGDSPPQISGVSFINQVFQQGGGNFMDAVSFHQYPIGRLPEQWVSYEVGRIQASVGPKPIWITEIGYPNSTNFTSITESYQADVLARTYLLGRAIPQLKRISWYDLQNDCADPANAECRYGILREDASPKPAYLAYKAVATTVADKPFLQMSNFNNEYIMRFGSPTSTTFALWNPSANISKSLNVGAKYFVLASRDGIKQIFVQSDSVLTLTLNPSPQYVYPLGGPPKMKSFHILPKRIIADTTQTLLLKASGEDTSDVLVRFSNRTIAWIYQGTGGAIDSDGVFHAASRGSGIIIGTYQGIPDTATVVVVPTMGVNTVEDFTSGQGWSLSVLNLDTAGTQFSISGERATSGATSGRLDYQFVYKSVFSVSQYRAYLYTDNIFPGRPDTLFVDFFGNGNPFRLEFRLRDGNGSLLTKSAANQPAVWNGVWRPIKTALRLPGESPNYPLSLDRVTVFTVPAVLQNDSMYTGAVFMDNIRLKYNDVTSIRQTEAGVRRFTLFQNYPNPFNPTTTIPFYTPERDFVTLKVCDALGREVATIAQDEFPPGYHEVRFDGFHYASGVYFYRLLAGHFSETKGFLLLK